MPKKTGKYIKVIQDMLKTIDELGCSKMATIDARLWSDHYRKVLKQLGIKPF